MYALLSLNVTIFVLFSTKSGNFMEYDRDETDSDLFSNPVVIRVTEKQDIRHFTEQYFQSQKLLN